MRRWFCSTGNAPEQDRVRKQRGRDTPVACQKLALLFLLSALFSACSPSAVERVEWTTMGTVAAVQMRGSAAKHQGLVSKCKYVCRLVTNDFNAHDPKAGITTLASLPDDRVLAEASAFARPCYEAAFRLMRESCGAFNPRWRGTNTLDCGAIAKGYALDEIYSYRDLSHEDCLVDIGGNLKSLRGDWKVGIAGSGTVITLTNGMACATSAEYYRGKHIYDGRTGLAVSNGVTSVTVVHPTSAMLADGLSTTLFVLGREEGERFLKAHYPEAFAYWQ